MRILCLWSRDPIKKNTIFLTFRGINGLLQFIDYYQTAERQALVIDHVPNITVLICTTIPYHFPRCIARNKNVQNKFVQLILRSNRY